MIRIIKKIPNKITVACSGGVDSMVFVDFLLKGKKKIELAFFNHDTLHSQKAEMFVREYSNRNNLVLHTGGVQGYKGKRSMEEFWRDERYSFFNTLQSSYIITCHHLDDCLESWVMSSMHGNPKLIPYHREPNIYRPFLMTSKRVIKKYACNKAIKWVEDPSNEQTKYIRNHTRHNVIPQILKINPGIRTTIRKKLIENYL